MKECPVCHAHLFSDMEVCYGCLHSFARDKEQACQEQESNEASAKAPVVAFPKSEASKSSKIQSAVMVEAAAPEKPDVPVEVATSVEPAVPEAATPYSFGQRIEDAPEECGAEILQNKEVKIEVPFSSGTDVSQLLQIVITVQVARDACARRIEQVPLNNEEAEASFEASAL